MFKGLHVVPGRYTKKKLLQNTVTYGAATVGLGTSTLILGGATIFTTPLSLGGTTLPLGAATAVTGIATAVSAERFGAAGIDYRKENKAVKRYTQTQCGGSEAEWEYRWNLQKRLNQQSATMAEEVYEKLKNKGIVGILQKRAIVRMVKMGMTEFYERNNTPGRPDMSLGYNTTNTNQGNDISGQPVTNHNLLDDNTRNEMKQRMVREIKKADIVKTSVFGIPLRLDIRAGADIVLEAAKCVEQENIERQEREEGMIPEERETMKKTRAFGWKEYRANRKRHEVKEEDDSPSERESSSEDDSHEEWRNREDKRPKQVIHRT